MTHSYTLSHLNEYHESLHRVVYVQIMDLAFCDTNIYPFCSLVQGGHLGKNPKPFVHKFKILTKTSTFVDT